MLPASRTSLTNSASAFGSNPYFMLTASHADNETVEDAVLLAKQLTEGFGDGPVEVVEL